MKNKIKNIEYLDSASTTKVDDRVLQAMLPYFTEFYGNASSNHVYGEIAKKAIEKARVQVAEIIHADKNEIYFTSGATEAINWALKGYMAANPDKGSHIITVKTEHKAVLNTCAYLETKGYEVTYLNVDENGLISLEDLENSIQQNTAMISVMYVNNEIGIIQPIKEIGEISKKHNIVFFCDATQAIGKIHVDVDEDNIDMLCFSAHKMNGPKGCGALYMKKGILIEPLIHGGGQEMGLRSGTYNTPLIVGLGDACKYAFNEFDQNLVSFTKMKKRIEKEFKERDFGELNFKSVPNAPHIMSFSLKEFDGEEFLLRYSKEFIGSISSACNSNIIEESHVLKHVFNYEDRKKVIRISI